MDAEPPVGKSKRGVRERLDELLQLLELQFAQIEVKSRVRMSHQAQVCGQQLFVRILWGETNLVEFFGRELFGENDRRGRQVRV